MDGLMIWLWTVLNTTCKEDLGVSVQKFLHLKIQTVSQMKANKATIGHQKEKAK